MLTTGSMAGYRQGILTEEYLGCSSPSHEVNHGILIVGYGRVNPNDEEDRVA